MNRKNILEILQDYKEKYKDKYFLEEIGLFGSVAKDVSETDSDIDIVVKLSKPDIYILGHIKTDLEMRLGKKVDIVRMRESMNDFLKKRIQKEAVYV
jgi:predicted nucleotidyltransferase